MTQASFEEQSLFQAKQLVEKLIKEEIHFSELEILKKDTSLIIRELTAPDRSGEFVLKYADL